MHATLVPHPTTAIGPVAHIQVELVREGAGLWLRFTAGGDVDRVLWPDPATAARADELWRHTCFEVFVRTPDGYREYNLSPSGQWASYAFDGYRNDMRDAGEVATLEPLDGASDQVALEARIQLPPDASALGLSAVVEDVDGGVSYWALAHPSDKPDFHHPDSFTLALPAAGIAGRDPA